MANPLQPNGKQVNSMDLKKLLAAAATTLALAAAPAHAAFITGAISFADGLENFGTTTSIVSSLTAIDDNPATPETADSCVGAFICPPGTTGAFASDFTIGVGGQLIYTYGGFTFTVETFSPITRNALTCANGGCGDSLLFSAAGTVEGNGFDPTLFTMEFSAQGRCVQAASGATECNPDLVTASWSSSVVATGRPGLIVPEPHTAVLLGIGLIALALMRRRRA